MKGMLVRPHMAAYCHYLPGPAVVPVHSEVLGKVFGKRHACCWGGAIVEGPSYQDDRRPLADLLVRDGAVSVRPRGAAGSSTTAPATNRTLVLNVDLRQSSQSTRLLPPPNPTNAMIASDDRMGLFVS